MSKSKQTQIKKHCKVCQDAGKPESVYATHFTRETPDSKSKVVCPTLLSVECRFCYTPGHTVKYCQILADNKKKEEKAKKLQQREQAKKNFKEMEAGAQAEAQMAKKNHQKNNVFALLNDEDEDEDVQENVQENVVLAITELVNDDVKPWKPEEFPSLVSSVKKSVVAQPVAVSYASMASKVPETYIITEKYEPKASLAVQSADYEYHEEFDEQDFEIAYEKAHQELTEEKKVVEEKWIGSLNMKASQMNWADYDTEDEDW
jgi:hypothetical protein